MNFFARNIAEIRDSKALRSYGFFLTFIHVLTYFSWRGAPAHTISIENTAPLCWSFFENCERFRLPLSTINAVLIGYLILSLVTSLLFLSVRTTAIAYVVATGIWIFKWGVIVQDFHLMGNYHYMAFIVAFAFLFLPFKIDLIRLLVIGFYVAAGALKLNPEWISGAAIYTKPIISGRLLELGCIYVIYLEFFVAPALGAKKSLIFWAALTQIIVFHIFSWHIVGFFFPTVMFCVLSIFIFSHLYVDEAPLISRFVYGRLPRQIYLVMAIFTLAQMAPLFFPGDSAITGEGRIYSLNLFDVKSDCHGYIISRFKNLTRDDSHLIPHTGVRIQCDPLMYYDLSRSLCHRYGQEKDFLSLSLSLYSKRTTDDHYQHLVDIPDFCKSNVHYSILRHNFWINARGDR